MVYMVRVQIQGLDKMIIHKNILRLKAFFIFTDKMRVTADLEKNVYLYFNLMV